MPLEMEDVDGGEPPSLSRARAGGQRFDGVRAGRTWWRPIGALGRVLLGVCLLAVLGGLAASALFLKNCLATDSRFRIAGADHIEAVGLTEVSRARMLPVFGEDIGRNIFFVNLTDRRRQLEEIPWVERATVMRLLPDRIRVQVVERRPVAFVRQGQQIGLVDASGVLLTMPAAMMALHRYSFPVVTGIEAGDPLPARKARMAVYERMLVDLDANGQRLSEQISEIDLTDPEDARVLMPEQGADILAHFGEDRFLERYQRYKAHIAEWRQQYPKLVAVDLRYDRQVVLEMDTGAGAAGADSTATSDRTEANAEAADASAGDAAGTAQAETKAPLAVKVKVTKPAKIAGARRAVKARIAAAKAGKKRAAAKRAALNASKRKTASAPPQAEVARQGQ
jgi:cell division protein FtsQ